MCRYYAALEAEACYLGKTRIEIAHAPYLAGKSDFAYSSKIAPERQVSEAAGYCKQSCKIGCRFVKLKSAYYINIGISRRNRHAAAFFKNGKQQSGAVIVNSV